jgi:peptide/nickel transport system permease protein
VDLTPYDPLAQNLRNTLQPPSGQHPFGTDNFGRDVFTRVLHAAQARPADRLPLRVLPVGARHRAGVPRRLLRRLVETIVMRTVDTFSAFPFLVMAIGIIAVLGPGVTSMYIALTLAGWSMYARIVRAEVLVVRQSEYVLAARALGYGHAGSCSATSCRT